MAASPSIERTCPGKLGQAAHFKRYTSGPADVSWLLRGTDSLSQLEGF